MSEAILGAILDAADEGLLVFDAQARCAWAGRRVGELFGVERNALIGGAASDVLALLASACEEPEALLAIAGTPTRDGAGELELMRPRARVVRWQSAPVEGAPGGWIAVVRDLTRERAAERRAQQLMQRLEAITATDALTQLPNRRRFFEELEREHGRAARAWDSYAILRADIDSLASINADLGQPRGDEVLERVADRMREGRREYDVLARLEEDEFVLLLPGADVHAARVVAERIIRAVAAAPLEIQPNERRPITVTIGAAVWVPPSGEVGADVVKRCGDALTEAKRRGVSSLHIDGEHDDEHG